MPSAAEAKQLLLQHMPPGARRWMALERAGAGVSGMWDAIAQALVTYGYDVLDQLRRELKVWQMVDRIPDWEQILRVADTAVARGTNTNARRSQIIARRREYGPSCIPAIQGALAPILGYAPDVLQHDRALVRALNEYSFGSTTAAMGTLASVTLKVGENGVCSTAGVQLTYNLSTGDAGEFDISLTAPDLTRKTWRHEVIVDGGNHILFGTEFAGCQVDGTWTLEVDNTGAGLTDVQVDAANLFAESLGRALNGAPGLGSIVTEWSAAIQESSVGAGYDRDAAIAATMRWNRAGENGGVALYQTDGGATALSDDTNCIADLCICS